MEDPNNSLKESVLKDEIQSLTEEYAEVGLDMVLTDEILKEIPIVKTLMAVRKIGISIKERFTIKKIISFLSQAGQASQEDRENFIIKLDTYSIGHDFFEKLMFILDKLDDREKAYVIGKLFKALIEEDITLDDFNNLVAIIDNSFFPYLKIKCLLSKNDLSQDLREKWSEAYYDIGSNAIDESLRRIGLINEEFEAKKEKSRVSDKEEIKVSVKRRTSRLFDILVKYGFDGTLAKRIYVPDISPSFERSVTNFSNVNDFIKHMKKANYRFSVQANFYNNYVDIEKEAIEYELIILGSQVPFQDAIKILNAAKKFYTHLCYIYITSDKRDNDYNHYVHIGAHTKTAIDEFHLRAIDSIGFNKILKSKSSEELYTGIRNYYDNKH